MSVNSKPTLEYLQELNEQKYNEEALESQRIDLALKLSNHLKKFVKLQILIYNELFI